MLGKLFSLGAGPGGAAQSVPMPYNRGVASLESVQEDEHTRNLLFPDPQDLYEHRLDEVFPLSTGSVLPAPTLASAFDYHGDIELEARDVRIIIMQDALSSVTASLLYDSQAAPPLPTSPVDRPTTAGPAHFAYHESRRTPTSPRKPSLGQAQRPVIIQPDSPGMRQGAFDRRPSIQGRHYAHVESDAQRAWREYREELSTFSSCIFGNSELMAYKGTSTKVHVVPSEPRPTDHPSLGDGRGSLGRSSMRSSRLSQSFSSENPPPFQAPPAPGPLHRSSDKKKVLITRLFPVTLPTDEEHIITPASRFSEDNSGFPFPHPGDESKPKKKKPQVKQKRTPMYAVALVITLPQAASQPSTYSSTRPVFRGPGSFNETELLPSSYNSTRHSPWALVGSTSNIDLEQSVGSDVDDPMEVITQHWDIIMRTVTRLQAVATTTLFTLLKQADLASPDPLPASMPSVSAQIARTPSLTGRRSEDGVPHKPPKTNAKHVTLLPNSLLESRQIILEVDMARTRIVAGLRATRVVTGQNRWPIWREEARWIAKRAGGKEQNFFFFNLLTGFLATHTDWLQALSPSSYRRRYTIRQREKAHEDTLLPSRTIIISQDKMAARRLIFLLSAFLPATQQLPAMGPHRSSISASLSGAFSQSPPSFVVPILKEESLRRKINRRGGPRRASHSRNPSQQSHHTRSGAVPGYLAHLSMEGRHERRSSDAASIKTTNLPIPGISGNDAATRKSSAATTATVTTETTTPHFSTAHRSEYGRRRPGSSSSLATDDLKRLAREDSHGSESRPNSRWGSVISGLWNPRRRDSTNVTIPPRSPSFRDSFGSPTKIAHPVNMDKLSQMVAEVDLSGSPKGGTSGRVNTSDLGPDQSDDAPRLNETTVSQAQPAVPPKPQSTPNPSGAYESPVKTSINLDDGVIDVDVPFPDYITASFETAVSSPSSSGYLSTPGLGNVLDSFEQACRVSIDGDTPVNVAGWLQQYHPDFVLQAVPSQPNLVEQIKTSMRAEPSPPLWINTSNDPGYHATERWMDISTALIADTTNFTITRLRYRRLVRARPTADRNVSFLSGSVGSYNSGSTALLTPGPPAIGPPFEGQEDEFIEEPIVVLDELLSAAVERVVATSNPVLISEPSSVEPSSRSASHHRRGETGDRRERSNSASTGTGSEDVRQSEVLGAEVPRSRCKRVVLSALEDVVREVIEDKDREKERNNGENARRGNESLLRTAVREWLEMVDGTE
ncbi:hypothetical protein GQ53DRAFT_26004 [Thozetella sp. PMI_491]|nr:hypothetical protein GQ53DRAFT_26004 [Thozetella sp. PMI_491]